MITLKYGKKRSLIDVAFLMMETYCFQNTLLARGGARAGAASKMERFVIIVNGWKPLTIITKHSVLEVVNYYHKPLHLGSR